VKSHRPHILVACVLALAMLAGAPRVLQNALTDLRFHWFPREAGGSIALVAIDAPSLNDIGVWPWPRQHHATLIDRLTSAGASEIVFDVDFSSPSSPEGDRMFADALQRAGGSVVLPAFKQWAEVSGRKALHINRPIAEFESHSWSAIVNVHVDGDGVVRRYPLGETIEGAVLPSIGALLAGWQDLSAAPIRIDFSIHEDSIPTVSYSAVLRGDPKALTRLKGKKVLIGATAIELGDRFGVPNGRIIAGPQLQILAAESIIQDRMLHATSAKVTAVGLIVLVLVMALLWRRRSVQGRVAMLAATAIVLEGIATVLQVRHAIVVETALWHIAIASYLAATALDEIDIRGLLGGIAERRFQQIAMSLGDGLVCADSRGVVTVWNPGAQAIFGYPAAEMVGKPLATLLASGRDTFSIQQVPLEASKSDGGTIVELEGRRKDGTTFPLEVSLSRWDGIDGFQYGLLLRDISVRKREAERVRYLAEHDTLTGIANRHALYEHLNVALAGAQEQGSKVALLVLDLDKFKQINDTHGHVCGDQILREVAKRLGMVAEADGFVARLSGDEFAVVVHGTDAEAKAGRLAERIALTFRKMSFFVEEREFRINASIGIAIHPDYALTADELFGNADLALYRAKASGRGRHCFFEQSIREVIEKQSIMESELAQALANGELELHYQPQVLLADGTLAGAEALIRWRHPHRGMLPPSEFMTIANNSSVSGAIARWVLEAACRQGRRWEEMGHPVRIGVNLSPSQLQSGDLAEAVVQALAGTGLSPHLLELEVTENILLDDSDATHEIFRKIRALGVHIAFDDFGTGYASLTYLKRFSLDRLKIDQSFVRNLKPDTEDAAIVRCAIDLAGAFRLGSIAEGVESAEVANLLRSMGCTEGQGYHYGAPMAASEFGRRFLGPKPAAIAAA
jgi:diguanylate cyclase (GGDEF)-like protein/PAS domain S-box-containing protein